MGATVVRRVSPTPDGATTTFFTPTQFVPGTLRIVLNGQLYEPDDMKWGWTENTVQQFTMDAHTPRNGDELQAFYVEADTGAQVGVEGVIGSPYGPGEGGWP
jgi:hypothetical protein